MTKLYLAVSIYVSVNLLLHIIKKYESRGRWAVQSLHFQRALYRERECHVETVETFFINGMICVLTNCVIITGQWICVFCNSELFASFQFIGLGRPIPINF